MTDAKESRAYADASTFVRLLGTSSRVRILDVLFGKRYTELSVSEIAKLAGLDKSTVYRNIDELVEQGLVRQDNSENGTARYSANLDNEITSHLFRAHTELQDNPVDFMRTEETIGPEEVKNSDERIIGIGGGFASSPHEARTRKSVPDIKYNG